MGYFYPPPSGGGGGGGKLPVPPQQASVLFTSSEIACGVQEKTPILRKTVSNIKISFFILFDLIVDTSVTVQILIWRILQQHVKVEENPSNLRSVEHRSKARGYFPKWPIILRCGSNSSIEMFCKPCYTQGGIAILRQMKEECLGKGGKGMERFWKRISKYFPSDFCSFKTLKTVDMHRELLLKAYEKVKESLLEENGIEPSLTACGEELSRILTYSFPYGEKSLRNLYNEANIGDEIIIKQPRVVQALAKYLGYADYRDFENKNSNLKEEVDIVNGGSETEAFTAKEGDKADKSRRIKNVLGLIIAVCFLICIGFFGYHYFNKQTWMEWEGTQYVETSFDSQKLKDGNLKVYKEERITDFRKILPNCETQFFNDDGSVKVWYGKNKEGRLQYFTGYGLHPETGKTLKPITKYMIGKHICP
ncbi:hypothetical protein Aeqsu_0180 [Aequorivita sublithincola DSM 14238]|uniref:Uncharacterized protein n=1 Tax=Aequorivita sublithincola (strain DSM 14238 / LMG 21431 / ACAM 643 / 9-3) TaxID=746697 RepID=I3YRT8_AEQSU|nr:hypothetical protein [Aequorivita sublithincola]AFL79706.1 hypothetical protein Aeqsu_0180 [Aequorivita sublithincola DSM 14238]